LFAQARELEAEACVFLLERKVAAAQHEHGVRNPFERVLVRAALRPKFANLVSDMRIGISIVAAHHGGCGGEEPGVFRLQRVNPLLPAAAVAPSSSQVGSQLANSSRQPRHVDDERVVQIEC
jgi:hypothetical protein